MLQIRNISKTYKTGDLIQTALKNVSLNLRDNEFVAILGPSGSGKTTLLNIIGGLDRYDEGDLIINNVSTKKYKDRDWDAYRNHTIGFVFQSYNLIPHQNVLKNVELALTISGISSKERKQRALEALDKVGLKDQAHKKPNQMSGGQMQRVAIARALVNNPSVLLADEPTGALDTKTSVQVMDLLKEVAKDRLVVMVTHNPELAEEYANRIVKLKDGEIVSDTNPFNVEVKLEKIKHQKLGKAKMGFFTALALSFNNLLTKKGRTILTAFAGSIGIIGIALILSLSQGFQNYIDKIQEDTLTSYPLSITSDTADITTAILSMVSSTGETEANGNTLKEKQYLTTMFSSIGSNDLATFKKYLEDNEDEYADYVSDIKYSYSVSPNIYAYDSADNLAKLYPSSMWSTLYSQGASSFMSSFSSSNGGMIFAEMPDDESIYDEYNVLSGRWPEGYSELVIVLSEPNSISDLLVYSIGLRDTKELRSIITSLMSSEEVDIDNTPLELTYDDLLNLDLRLIKQTDTYKYNAKYDIYEDMSEDDEFMEEAFENALKLKVVGVVCPKDPNATSNSLSPGVNFKTELTQYVIDEAKKTSIVQKQIANKDIDVISGKTFEESNDEEEILDFEDMISVDEDKIKDAFKVNISEDDIVDEDAIAESVTEATMAICKNLSIDTTAVEGQAKLVDEGIAAEMCGNYLGQYKEWAIKPENSGKNFLEFVTYNPYSTFESNYYSTSSTYKSTMANFSLMDKFEPNTRIMCSGIFETAITDSNLATNLEAINAAVDENAKTVALATAFDTHFNTVKATTEGSTAYNLQVAEIVKYSNGTLIGKYIGTALADSMSGLSDLFDEDMFEVDTDKFAEAFTFDMDEDELSRIMTTMMSGSSEKSYKSNLISLGYQDVDDPTSISFYFNSFESKENFLDFLDKYNEGLDEEDEITYTDITGILMSSVKTIVDSVSYVLIAFVSISLVVSSIMIAVITLISVMERTKEIGILRAMGASKSNVSSIFNAETFIIGLLSGLLGVGVTYAAVPSINALIHKLTNNFDINAVLEPKYALILVAISVVLTMVAGLIPSRKASKQDPVIALRSE